MQDYIPDPAAEAQWVVDGFFSALAAGLPDTQWVDELRRNLDADCARFEEKYQRRLVDAAARYTLHQGVAVLMAYRRLHSSMPTPELLELLRHALVDPLRAAVGGATSQALDAVDDPFTKIVGISKLREQSTFGASFTFERRRDDNQGYYLDIVRCLWHSFFVAEECPELTAIFCAFDNNWIEAIDPGKHGVKFERATTLGTGGMLCPFHFFRVSRYVGKAAAEDA